MTGVHSPNDGVKTRVQILTNKLVLRLRHGSGSQHITGNQLGSMCQTKLGCSQVWRWAQQYKSQLLREPMPEMMALIGWLQRHIPAEDSDPNVTRVSHGDFRRAPLGTVHGFLFLLRPEIASIA